MIPVNRMAEVTVLMESGNESTIFLQQGLFPFCLLKLKIPVYGSMKTVYRRNIDYGQGAVILITYLSLVLYCSSYTGICSFV
jgi:hypothetical protein